MQTCRQVQVFVNACKRCKDESMEIHGFQKLTLLDYPEHIAATVFTGGCNFRCPFCHNASLVLNTDSVESISEEEFFKYISKS